jgi:Icc-related predicted phosphoesterase
MKIVAISDTHGFHNKLTVPDGDMLICAGDFSMKAKALDVQEFAEWFNKQPHEFKVIVAGNHDMACEPWNDWTHETFLPAVYLNHEEATVGGLRIFGSPFSSSIYEPSPWSFDYNPKGPRSEALWSQIPDHLDILITHGPPKGILDKVAKTHPREDANVGDVNLLYHVKRALPRAHVFGHIHEGAGAYESDCWTTKFYNACICDAKYKPTNPVTVFNL